LANPDASGSAVAGEINAMLARVEMKDVNRKDFIGLKLLSGWALAFPGASDPRHD
jgi:hypothetical protein